MAKINKQTFVLKCKAIDPGFQESVFGDLVPQIEAYDKALDQNKTAIANQAELKIQFALKSMAGPVKTKFATALAYVQTQIKLQLTKFPAFPFNQTVPIPGRTPLKIIGEDFTNPSQMQEIISDLKLICVLVHELALRPSNSPWNNWFPESSYAELCSSLKNLDSFLNMKCTLLTYRKLELGKRCDSSNVKRGLAGQVIPNLIMPGFDRPDFRAEGGNVHVQSGLRIFFGPLYFSVKEKYDAMLTSVAIYRFMTHFHEMTHKILKTQDEVYELPNCKAIKDTPRAIKCADSWGYYLTDYAATTNRLPGGKTGGSKVSSLRGMWGG